MGNRSSILYRKSSPIFLGVALLCTLFLSLSFMAHDGIQRPHHDDETNDLLGRFLHDRIANNNDTDGGSALHVSEPALHVDVVATTATTTAPKTATTTVTNNATESKAPPLELVDDSRSCFRARPSTSTSTAIIKPILNLGFPKQGSTTLQQFFKCGGLDSSHYKCRKKKPEKGPGWHEDVFCGKCIRFGRRKKKTNLLESCGSYEAYTQLDVELELEKGGCYFPQIIALDLMHDEKPNATFVLTFRPVNKWISSIEHWRGFDTPMIDRLGQCGIRGLDDNTPQGLADWWCGHVERIRKYVADHPSHQLVEIDIEGEDTGKTMARRFGINEECWSHSNKNVLRGLADHEIRNMTANNESLPKWMRRDIVRRKNQAKVGQQQQR